MKILVVANVEGRFRVLFRGAQKLSNGKSGPFDALFCVGRFFGKGNELTPYIVGTEKIPLPTYFICGDEESADDTSPIDAYPDGGEICPHLHYLGPWGRREICGISVCYLSGYFDENRYTGSQSEESTWHYTEEQVEELLILADAFRPKVGIDVLLTSEWGEGFDNLHAVEDQFSPDCDDLNRCLSSPPAPSVGRLGRELSPRYHFAASRPPQTARIDLAPYSNRVHTTRFYGLSSPLKFRAFALDPKAPPAESPSANPYLSTRKVDVSAFLKKPGAATNMQGSAGLKEEPRKNPPAEGDAAGDKVSLEVERGPLSLDPNHHTYDDTGDWRCGYCNNVNRVRFGQTERCNMRNCQAPRMLGPLEKGGSLSAAARAVLAAQEHTSLCDILRPGMREESPPLDEAPKKKQKRVSLYANQGGGMHKERQGRTTKKGKRSGEPGGQYGQFGGNHTRDKW